MLTNHDISVKSFKKTRKKLYTIKAVYIRTDLPMTKELKELLSLCKQQGRKYRTNTVGLENNNFYVRNYLENSVYPIFTEGDVDLNEDTRILLIGTKLELWGVPLKKVLTQYTKSDGSLLNPQMFKPNSVITLQSKPSNECYAAFIPRNQQVAVQTAWGDTLIANREGVPHGNGDYLVCNAGHDGLPALEDTWVVNGFVFPTTYDMRSFPQKK